MKHKNEVSEGNVMDYYGTIGPACADPDILKKMAEAGMTGLRMNLSHGSLSMHGDWIQMIREAVIRGLLIDLQGPELRVQGLGYGRNLRVPGSEDVTISMDCSMQVENQEELVLETGAYVKLVSEEVFVSDRVLSEEVKRQSAKKMVMADASAGSITDCVMIGCPEILMDYLVPGQELLLDDGKILLKVLDGFNTGNPVGTDGKAAVETDIAVVETNIAVVETDQADMTDIAAVVIRGGVLKNRKSIALPGREIPTPTLTAEDLENLRNAKAAGVTGVMLPFVRGREDILALKEALASCGAEHIRIFAKIENLAGVEALPDFVKDVDHVVIARGDLGNAMPLWELPGCQKRLAAICRQAGTPFMVVTQMLDSMHTRAVPTRAEVSDIYNAVMDGAASVMLTGETAAGSYPVEAMRYLVNTAECALQDRTGEKKDPLV
ncbi:MAG: pyruvate kinase [Lachnospiraceae bacterium]